MMTTTSISFPELLKSWRARYGVSQLELSLRCEVSQKHISFLELARTSPSRSMVLLICEALDIPLRDR
ncbi:MAG: helix-turn-helix domain-containing protein, partial [Geminicoccaceae bacterium]